MEHLIAIHSRKIEKIENPKEEILKKTMELQEQGSPKENAVYDVDQERVIILSTGYHLVLAPPGCGKTQILAERVLTAVNEGKNVEDMLCLTFTNRAARGMRNRINTILNNNVVSNKLFVGNLHRLCSSFLYEHKIIAQTSAILDESDTTNIILNLLHLNETDEELEYDIKEIIQSYYQLQHYIYQLRNHHEKDILLDVKGEFSSNILTFCKELGVAYSENSFIQIYDELEELIIPESAREFAIKLQIAKDYDKYKENFGLNDFDDLLLKAYDYMVSNPDQYKKYDWIQIDEVQDLNRIQLSIVDCLFTGSSKGILLYLGDEQQAIFSFIGAKLSTLDYLKIRCEDNLHHMQNNHRSPKYLLDVFNTYAEEELGVDSELLPAPTKFDKEGPKDLIIEHTKWNYLAHDKAVDQALSYPNKDKTAILVPVNKDADEISKILDDRGISHFKVSGKDLFSESTIQTLFAHFNVIGFESNLLAWSKIIKNLKIYPSYALAREFMSNLQSLMLCPTDFIYYNNSSYVERFLDVYKGDMVVFDTETTGLNVFEDDIVQIAAIRLHNGIQVGETFNFILHTEKDIPEFLGDTPNPLINEYKTRTHLNRAEGLNKFLDFVGDTPLLGHNVEYDYRILDYNLRRDCNRSDLSEICLVYFDSLKLAHIIDPKLKSYKLKNLLTILDIEGENSHLADGDIMATKSVVEYYAEKSSGIIQRQKHFIQSNATHIAKFVSIYKPLYLHTKNRLYSKESYSEYSVLVDELLYLYNKLTADDIIRPLDKFNYVLDYLNKDVIRKDLTPTLKEQLDKHVIEMNTFKEADLCDEKAKSMQEHIFISTVHKAKGLEFTNVIVCSVVDGVYPNFGNKEKPNKRESDHEDARKLYVAITRAKKRLCLIYFENQKVYSKKWEKVYTFNAWLSPFVRSIRPFFNETSE